MIVHKSELPQVFTNHKYKWPAFVLVVLGALCSVVCGAAQRPQPRSRIAVVKAVAAVPASERTYAASLADSTLRILTQNGVKADLVSDGALDAALKGRDLAFLVTCTKPTPTQIAALARFRGRGGVVRPLYSAAPQVVSIVGAKPALKVRDAESVKARYLLNQVGANVPGAWNRSAWERKQKVLLAAASTLGRAQRPRAGEIHAVWEHTGLGLYPGDWPRTFRVLRANGVTDLFVNVSGAGFAHYASNVLPRSKEYSRYGDQLEACLKAARGTGVRVHAWVICFNATRADSAYLLAFQKKGWRLKNRQGALTEYLNPSNPDLRWRMIKSIDELVRAYPVAGVHLDFVRWYEDAPKPANAARHVTTFVESVRKRLHMARPGAWLTAAVLASHPSCVASVGQDWPAWIDADLIDYAVPMNYVEKRARYASLVAQQGSVKSRARRIIGGIGVTANESKLSAAQVVEQINLTRQAGFAGVALFDLDDTLVESIFPVLRLGLFRTR